MLGFVFDVGEKYVPHHRDAVHIEDPAVSTLITQCDLNPPPASPELSGNQKEVDCLTGRPDQPVKQVNCGELGLKLAPTGL